MRTAVPLACAALLAGCGGSQEAPPSPIPDRQTPERNRGAAAPSAEVREARCPRDAAGCESATGTVIYVEAVDPDGDGDAHLVLESAESVTGPGISVVDVRRDLRPRPLPGPGDLVSASGPVHRGSYGQRQIHARLIRVGE